MAQFTKKAILQTFQEMLEKTPFDKITVSAIVAKCEISSNTFYYHFRDIYDLLDTWLLIKEENYTGAISEESRWQDIVKAVLMDLRSNRELVYHLFNSLSRERLDRFVFESTGSIFYRMVCHETSGMDIPEHELKTVAEYSGYAFLGFLLKFLWNDMEGDIDAGIAKISFVFEGNIQWLKDRYSH